MMDAHRGEYLRRRELLVSFHHYLVVGDSFVLLIAKDGDHIKSRAARQGCSDKFNRLGSGLAGGIVNQNVMATSRFHLELALIRKCKSYFALDHRSSLFRYAG